MDKRHWSQWHKDSVHGALRWSALSRAAKPHCSKRFWRVRRDPAPGHGGCRYHRRRRQQGGPPSQMDVEATFATTNFMGDSYTFVDCPGSIEIIQDMRSVPAVDAAVVVCEADEREGAQLPADPARAGIR